MENTNALIDKDNRKKIFERNLTKVYNRAFHYAERVLCNKDDAKDIVQEAALKAWENFKHDSIDQFNSWFFKFIIRELSHYQRSVINKKRYVVATEDLQGVDINNVISLGYSYEEYFDKFNTLMLLNNKERNLLLLRASGYSYQEIAIKYNIKKNTLEVALYRAHNKLTKLSNKSNKYYYDNVKEETNNVIQLTINAASDFDKIHSEIYSP
ncbi:MAG: sigma-70 family RNA polymerase sigma factor [Chlorobi bacterium]|nr:sigma-70 family RNA polymerase sigma factor [Chlorobiota bacterium]